MFKVAHFPFSDGASWLVYRTLEITCQLAYDNCTVHSPLPTIHRCKSEWEKGGREEIVLDSNDSPRARRISRQPTGKSVLIGDRAANFRRHRSFSVSRLNATSSPSSSLSYFLNEPESEWPLSPRYSTTPGLFFLPSTRAETSATR